MKRLQNFLLNTFLGGFLVILPLAIFVLLIQMALNLVKNVLSPISKTLQNEIMLQVPEYVFSLFAFTIVIITCFLIGLFIRTRMGKKFLASFEQNYLLRLPLYGTIKETVQQFTGAKKMPFSDVVLVDVFGNGTRMTGFITDEHESGNLTVFVPTGPNPTNGFIFHVGKDQVTRLEKKVGTDDAMRSIISVGVGSKELMKF